MNSVCTEAPVILQPLPERDTTYAAYAGQRHVGYIRWTADDVWIARTTGNAEHSADLKRFAAKNEACRWLLRAVDGVQPRRGRAAA